MERNGIAAAVGLGVILLSPFRAAFAEDKVDIALVEQQAQEASKDGDFTVAASIYQNLVENNPQRVDFRLRLADALKNDRQWDRSMEAYKSVLAIDDTNLEALLGIGTIQRWQGRVEESKKTFELASTLHPESSAPQLGLAASYAADNDLVHADELYAQAESRWPDDTVVSKEASELRVRRNPKIYLFWEGGLSFQTRQVGMLIPFVMKEEFGIEGQEEISYAPQLDHAKIYTRTDQKMYYIHHIGMNHAVDVSARHSKYDYLVPSSSLEYASIDSYQEYRVRYTRPLTNTLIGALRYTARPTTLKLSHERFAAHKIEADLDAQLTPRVNVHLGGGWLRDMDSNATLTTHLTNRSLVKAGVDWDVTNRFGVGAKYITNPDLDNTMRATAIAEADYSLMGSWSVLGRYRVDDYKKGSNQMGYYLGARFVPNNKLWSEFGVKYEKRGASSGSYGLVSINYRF